MSNFAEIRKHQEKQNDEEHKIRVERAVVVARKLLATLATGFETIPLGDIEKTDKAHGEMAKKLLAVILEENLPYSDMDFCFQVAMQALSFPATIVQDSLKESFQRCLTGLFGKPARNVTAQEMDELLKKADAVDPENVLPLETAE